MTVRCMVRDEIEQHADAERMRGGEQRVELLERPKQGGDASIVRDVVAEVGHRGGKDRRDPDGNDAELNKVRQAASNAKQIADAVLAAILKRPRIYLINDGALPPGCPGHGMLGRRKAQMKAGKVSGGRCRGSDR